MSNAPVVPSNRLFPADDMLYYDKLPQEIRCSLANAIIWINSETIYSIYQITKNAKMCCQAISQIETQAKIGVI